MVVIWQICLKKSSVVKKCNVFFSAFHSAKDDGVDIDALAAEIEGAGAGKEQSKPKSKKKKGKKDDFE